MEINIAEEDLRRKRQKLSSTTSTIPLQNANHKTFRDSPAMDSRKIAAAMTSRNTKEEEVGILQFVNTTTPGFTGILKKRYTDFLVNEIKEDGTVVHLTDTSTPKRVQPKKEVKVEPKATKPVSQASKTNDATDKDGKEQAVTETPVTNGDVKPEETTATNGDTEMTDVGDVKVEQKVDGTSEAKTSESNVETTNQAVQDAKTEAVDSKADAVEDVQGDKIETSDVKIAAADGVVQDGKTETSAPKVEESTSNAEKPAEESFISEEDRTLLTGYFGTEVCNSILALYKKFLERPDGKAGSYGTVTTEPINDRQLRTEIHGNVRRIFNSTFETSSNEDGTMRVAIGGRFARGGQQGNQRGAQYGSQYGGNQPKGKVGWAELGGEHLHFSLLKENKDTMEVIGFLASSLRVQPKSFAFAGTKDRRGVTVQRVSLFRGDAKKLVRLNRDLRQSMVGELKYEKHGLNLGDLQGNQFIIVLRDCHFDNESFDESLDEATRLQAAKKIVEQSVENMSEHGFLNYYGLQRFGSFSAGTHDIGRFILKGDFRAAVQSIISFNPDLLDVNAEQDNTKFGRDDIARAFAIDMFQKEGSSEAALRKMPKKFSAETAILRWLKGQRQNDYIGALLSINRGLRLMYVHAYQSFVWNCAASERWARFGNTVVEGDLVLVESKDGNVEDAEADGVDENGEVVVKPASDDVAISLEDQFQRARALSKEEASSGEYSVFDVVLPTPGYDIEYPKNEIGEFYKEFMASEEGGGLDPMNMRRSQKDFSLSGSYRKLLGKAKDVSVDVKMYGEETEQLVETDFDRFYAANPDKKPAPYQPQAQQPRNQQQQGNSQLPRNQQRQGYSQQPRWGRQQQRFAPRQDLPPVQQPAMNTWANFKGNLAESDKAMADLAKAQKAARALEPPKETPKVEDKFIETSAKTGKRTGHRETVIKDFKPLAVEDDKSLVSEGSKLSAPEDIPLPATPQPESKGTHELKRSAAQMNSETSSTADDKNLPTALRPKAAPISEKKPGGEVTLERMINIMEEMKAKGDSKKAEDEVKRNAEKEAANADKEVDGNSNAAESKVDTQTLEKSAEQMDTEMSGIHQAEAKESETKTEEKSTPASKKLAIIVTFKLGSSQYATMALRELMKSGGVQEYKSGFSGR